MSSLHLKQSKKLNFGLFLIPFLIFSMLSSGCKKSSSEDENLAFNQKVKPVPSPSPSPVLKLSYRAEYLLKQNRIQEAIWVASRVGDPKPLIDKMKTDLRNLLENNQFDVMESSLLGKTKKSILKFENSIQALFKLDGGTEESIRQGFHPSDPRWLAVRAANAESEVAASELDDIYGFNIVPKTILKKVNGETGSAQYLVQDASGGGVGQYSPDFINMEIFDYIAGNSDRHSSNWLYLYSDDLLIAIDHGFSFRGADGGCFVGKRLFISFASGRRCLTDADLASLASFYGYKVEDLKRDLPFVYTYYWKFVEVSLYDLSQRVKDNILNTPDSVLYARIAPHMQPKYFNKLLERVHLLQAALR